MSASLILPGDLTPRTKQIAVRNNIFEQNVGFIQNIKQLSVCVEVNDYGSILTFLFVKDIYRPCESMNARNIVEKAGCVKLSTLSSWVTIRARSKFLDTKS